MVVRDGHRGRGVGSSLVEACIDWSRAHAAHKVALSVWPHNERALRLYRRYGCTTNQITQARKPLSFSRLMSATARARPIVARLPLSR
jgi:RimJ/RimL family protein N-acetyltransferase